MVYSAQNTAYRNWPAYLSSLLKHTTQAAYPSKLWCTKLECSSKYIHLDRMWVIPYQFAKVLQMIPSELEEIWCVSSPGGHMCPTGISPPLLVWLLRNGSFNVVLFCYFCYTCDHSKRHNLGIFHCFEE